MTPTIKSLICIHKPSIELILRSFLNHKGNKRRCKESTIRGHRKNLSPRRDSQSEGIFWFIILLIYRHRRNTRFFCDEKLACSEVRSLVRYRVEQSKIRIDAQPCNILYLIYKATPPPVENVRSSGVWKLPKSVSCLRTLYDRNRI